MAKIRVDIDHMIVDGMPLTFRAPCVSASVDCIKIYYPNESGVLQAKEFTFKDCHGNALASFDNLFVSGAYVKVILNTTAAEAYIQNADTNAYLEARFKALEENSGAPAAHTHDVADISGILPVANGGTGVSDLDSLRTALGVYRIATGTFTGATNNSSVKISHRLGVTPVAVMLCGSNGIGVLSTGIGNYGGGINMTSISYNSSTITISNGGIIGKGMWLAFY